jgi:hypothetical protein
MLGVNAFVVPYKSDMVAFRADGSMSVGRRSLRPEDLSKCEYRRIVAAGRAFRLSGFAMYSRQNQNGVPQLFVPASGWLKSDRADLFQALADWLGTVGSDVDEKVRQRLDELTRNR